MAANPGLLPFGQYRPDVSDYEGEHSRDITNVIPQGDGYGPFPALVGTTAALASACRGTFYGIKNDGTVATFAGTSTKLYLLDNTSQSWIDVSKGGGTYTTLNAADNWAFAQFNNFVFATQVNAPVQVIDLTSPTAFADLGGSPPQARYVAVVNQFLVLSGLAAPNVYRIQWSGLAATTTWTAGVNQSSFTDLADGGIVRGVAGGEFGIVFQDRAIRRMTYSPGSPYIFDFVRIATEDGLFAPYSVVAAVEQVFYLSPQGFKMLAPGAYPVPIGKERVDRTFFNDLDLSNLQLVIGSIDPKKQRVYWAYKSVNGSVGAFDKMLCYDWALDRWTILNVMGQYLTTIERAGVTLEGTDAAYGDVTPIAVTSISHSSSVGDTFTVATSPSAGQGINFTATTLPYGLIAGTPYYVKATSRTTVTFKISATGGVGTLEGAAFLSSTTSTGSGTLNYYLPSIEALSVPTFDGIAVAAQPQLAAIDMNNKLGFFTGANLEAKLETAQRGGTLKRIYVRGYKPITDAATVFGSITYAENLFTSVSQSTEDPIDNRGWVWPGISTRYARGKIRIPAGTSWTYAAGVEPDVAPEGQR